MPGLRPLVFCNSGAGRTVRDQTNSTFDPEEATNVAKVS